MQLPTIPIAVHELFHCYSQRLLIVFVDTFIFRSCRNAYDFFDVVTVQTLREHIPFFSEASTPK